MTESWLSGGTEFPRHDGWKSSSHDTTSLLILQGSLIRSESQVEQGKEDAVAISQTAYSVKWRLSQRGKLS